MASNNLPGVCAGVGYQFARHHFAIRRPAAKLNFMRPVSRQMPQADGLLGQHSLEQSSAVFLNGYRQNHLHRIIPFLPSFAQIPSRLLRLLLAGQNDSKRCVHRLAYLTQQLSILLLPFHNFQRPVSETTRLFIMSKQVIKTLYLVDYLLFATIYCVFYSNVIQSAHSFHLA